MRLQSTLLPTLAFAGQVLANTSNDKGVVVRQTRGTHCDLHDSELINARPADWEFWGTSKWLSEWIEVHMKDDEHHRFDQVWSQWGWSGIGWSCADNGEGGCVPPDFCADNEKINEKSDLDFRRMVYVTRAIHHLRGYFHGMNDALATSGIQIALGRDQMALDFHDDEKEKNKGVKEGLTTAGIAIGIAVSFIVPFLAPAVGAAAVSATTAATIKIGTGLMAASSVMANTVPGLVTTAIESFSMDAATDFERGADMGEALEDVFNATMRYLTDTNNRILTGTGSNKGEWKADCLTYFEGGGMMNFDGVGKIKEMVILSDMLTAVAINRIWRSQKVGIVGGLPCGQDQGIGLGPKEWEYCHHDNTAWYIYHWEEELKNKQKDGAGVIMPHGMDLLGKGDYDRIKWQDVMKSSLAVWEVDGLGYNPTRGINHFRDSVKKGELDIIGPAWEGLFDIPVCDIGIVPGQHEQFEDSDTILTKYGSEEEPRWCGAVCSGQKRVTDTWIDKTNMKDFDDNPRDHC